jgi:hypothetical protein
MKEEEFIQQMSQLKEEIEQEKVQRAASIQALNEQFERNVGTISKKSNQFRLNQIQD